MKKNLVILAAGLAVGAIPATASAQWQVDVRLQGTPVVYHGISIAPYRLQIPVPDGPVFDVFCIDSETPAHRDVYTTWVSPVTLTTLQYTKVYVEEIGGGAGTSAAAATAFETYWQTAWLASQYFDLGLKRKRAAVQGALWQIGGRLADGGVVWDGTVDGPPAGIGDWVAAASAAYATDPGQIDGSGWFVLTTTDPNRGQQEFLVRGLEPPTTVPEPATWLLLASGLALVAFVRLRRARSAA